MAVENLYTQQEATNLQTLSSDLYNAKVAYDAEFAYNTIGHQNAASGKWIKPYPGGGQTDQQDFMSWLAASDTSLGIKKAVYESAKAAYNAEVTRLENKYQQTLGILHPEVAIATQTASIQAAADQKIKIAEASFIAGNTKWIVVGVVVLIIAIAAIVYFKRKKKLA